MKWQLCEVMDILISSMVTIISQSVRTPEHHIVHVQCIHFLFVNYTSVELEKKIALKTQLNFKHILLSEKS